MHWFEGSIPAAIAEAKEKKKLFLVYIEGKDELSKEMTATYDDKSVTERLEKDGCVSVKLESDSESCKQFSQIYPVCIIPSSFFIGNDGIPLEVIAGNLEPEKFLSKVDKAIKLHNGESTYDSSKTEDEQEASGNGTTTKDGSVSTALLNTETTSTYSLSTYQVSSAAQKEKSMDTEVPSHSNTSEEPKQSTSSEANAEEFELKVKRARRLIEEKNIQKEEEAKKRENDKEVERRKVGKELQKSQRQKEINELQEWAQDRAKEKEEERLAREKVLAQIAQDRAERAVRYQQTTEKKINPEQQQSDTDRKPENETVTAATLHRSNFANIQFRLPDSTSIVHQFPASATLEEANQYINENIKLGYSSFTLSTTFPRREFTRNDYSQTLQDLQLVPSATILIIPVHTIRTRSDGGGLAAILWGLLTPFTMIWSYIISHFSTSNSATKNTNENTSQQSTSSQDNEKREEGDMKKTPRKNFYHQDGNIYRLSNQQGDDDDNNTWNGNSTQQM